MKVFVLFFFSERVPVRVMVGPPEGAEGMPTLFDLMKQAVKEYLRMKEGSSKKIMKAREQASQNIKVCACSQPALLRRKGVELFVLNLQIPHN